MNNKERDLQIAFKKMLYHRKHLISNLFYKKTFIDKEYSI